MKTYRKAIKIVLYVMLVLVAAFPTPVAVKAANQNVLNARNGVVRVISMIEKTDGTYISSGTGFAIGVEGEPVSYFITNNHVIVEAPDSVFIVLENLNVAESIYYAEVVQTWSSPDIAILKIETPITARSALPLLSTQNLEVTQDIYALGFPGVSDSMNDEGQTYPSTIDDITVTSGTVTKKRTDFLNTTCVQIDAVINHGNSGGPLVNESGEVVGINTYGAVNQDGTAADGTNYAIYIDYIMEYCNNNNISFYQSSQSEGNSAFEDAPLDEGTIQEEEQPTSGSQTNGDIPIDDEASEDTYDNQSDDSGYYGMIGVAAFFGLGIYWFSKKKRKNNSVTSASKESLSIPINNENTGSAEHKSNRSISDNTGIIQVTGTNGYFANNSFTINDRIKIGRDSTRCNLVFPPKTAGVSSVHCEIINVGGHLELIDRGSTYGTYIGNNKKLTVNTPYQLQPGDSFYLGSPDNKFKIG